jgi:predicted MFS family arabinose efflux permease
MSEVPSLDDAKPTGLSGNHPAIVLIALGTLARLPPAMIFIALLFRVQEVKGSYAVAGLASGAYVVARAVSGPAVGRLVDRIGQTRVLVATALLAAALLSLFAVLPGGTPSIVLILVAAAVGAARPPLSGCVRALLPELVDASNLHSAYAAESTAFELTFILGPPLALAIASVWSTSASLLVCAALLAASTLLFAAQPASRHWRPRSSVNTTRRGGAIRSPGIRTFIVVLTMAGGVFGVVDVALPAALKALHNNTAAAGPVLGLWGFGSLIGGLVVARFFKPALVGPRGLLFLLVLLGSLHGALSATTSHLAAMAVVVTVAGATIAPTYTNIYSAVDGFAPAGTATEAFSWLESAVSAGSAGGSALAGVLVQDYGSGKTFLAAAAFGLCAVIVTAARFSTIDRPTDAKSQLLDHDTATAQMMQ